jgi:putative ABC transport system substrate-binding protein
MNSFSIFDFGFSTCSGNKRILCLAVCAVLIALCVPAEAQQTRIYRLGFLSGGFGGSNRTIRSIGRELRNFGYVEGKNIAFEYRYAEDKPDRSPALAHELVRLNVDTIIAGGPGDTRAAMGATNTIPIVFLESPSDPVEQGLVASVARPGGNVTGFTSIAWVLAGKRLELLKETIPSLSRVAVLWNPKAAGNASQWAESQQTARQLGLQLHSMEVSSADQYENAFKEAIKIGSSALAVTRHRLTNTYQKRIVALATKNRWPAIYPREDFSETGGLMSYGADDVEAYKRVASMIDKILKGAKPADLPVEQPTKFEFIINLKTAKQIGITIPPNVLSRADRVIR